MAEWTEDELTAALEPDVARARQIDGDALFAAIAAETVDEAPSPRRRLQTLPSSTRRLLGLGVLLVVASLVVGLQGVRTDLQGGQWAQLLALVAPLCLLGGVSAWITLRPLHQPFHRVLKGGAVAWLLALAIAALPLWPGLSETPSPPWSFHLYCLGVTCAATLGVTSPLLVLDRGRRPAPWRKAFAAAAGGLMVLGVQALFCPIVDVPHLLLGHGSAAIWIGGLVLGIGWLRTQLGAAR